MKTRKDFANYFLDVAMVCAKQATCLRRRYGAVIVDDSNRIISTGYNGSPRETIDCLERNYCWREKNNIPSGSNYEKCGAVHAEMNAIINSTRDITGLKIFLAGFDVSTGKEIHAFPCYLCSKMLVNAGIEKLYNRNDGDVELHSVRQLYEKNNSEVFSIE